MSSASDSEVKLNDTEDSEMKITEEDELPLNTRIKLKTNPKKPKFTQKTEDDSCVTLSSSNEELLDVSPFHTSLLESLLNFQVLPEIYHALYISELLLIAHHNTG